MEECPHASRKKLWHVDLEGLLEAKVFDASREKAVERIELFVLAEEVPPVRFRDFDVRWLRRLQTEAVAGSRVVVDVLRDVFGVRA